jgi:hypothetical protein
VAVRAIGECDSAGVELTEAPGPGLTGVVPTDARGLAPNGVEPTDAPDLGLTGMEPTDAPVLASNCMEPPDAPELGPTGVEPTEAPGPGLTGVVPTDARGLAPNGMEPTDAPELGLTGVTAPPELAPAGVAVLAAGPAPGIRARGGLTGGMPPPVDDAVRPAGGRPAAVGVAGVRGAFATGVWSSPAPKGQVPPLGVRGGAAGAGVPGDGVLAAVERSRSSGLGPHGVFAAAGTLGGRVAGGMDGAPGRVKWLAGRAVGGATTGGADGAATGRVKPAGG